MASSPSTPTESTRLGSCRAMPVESEAHSSSSPAWDWSSIAKADEVPRCGIVRTPCSCSVYVTPACSAFGNTPMSSVSFVNAAEILVPSSSSPSTMVSSAASLSPSRRSESPGSGMSRPSNATGSKRKLLGSVTCRRAPADALVPGGKTMRMRAVVSTSGCGRSRLMPSTRGPATATGTPSPTYSSL